MKGARLRSIRRQRGVTLLVGLIMLVILLVMAVSTFNLSRSNTSIVGNMQNKQETTNAAIQATELVISTTKFMETPANAISNTCGTNRVCVDVNGDGTNDVSVALSPAPCAKKIQVIKNSQLDMSKASDSGCALGVTQSLGVSGAATGNSLCADAVWEISASASDTLTQAATVVKTGVAVRVSSDEALDTSKACS